MGICSHCRATRLASRMPLNTADELDSFIRRHLNAKHGLNGKMNKYEVADVMSLCELAKEVIGQSPMLATMNPPVVIVGDIHGQYFDLLRVFSMLKNTIDLPIDRKVDFSGALNHKFMFLGDYVDRGRHSLECIMVVLALKCRYPERYQLLRGNHECRGINKEYGFFDEITDRFGEEFAEQIWNAFNEVFTWMPVAGLIGKRILCMHGGLSAHLTKLSDIDDIPRPLEDPNASPLAMDLLWADPMDNVTGFRFNCVRGVSVFFGVDTVKDACDRLGLNLIVRAHQMMMSGHSHFADRKLLTIFTAPRYQAEMPNNGAVALVSSNGHVGIQVLKPSMSASATGNDISDSGSLYAGREDVGAKKRLEKEQRKGKGTRNAKGQKKTMSSSSVSASKTK